MTAKDEHVTVLWDYSVSHPDGFDRDDAERDLGWDHVKLSKIARHLRMLLADDEITLVCVPQGDGKPWRYKLVGTYDEAAPWTRNRRQDMETRLDTMHAVALSLVGATDGRTADGKKARLIEKFLRRLKEDLADVGGELA